MLKIRALPVAALLLAAGLSSAEAQTQATRPAQLSATGKLKLPPMHVPTAAEIGTIRLDPSVTNGIPLILSVNGKGTIRHNGFNCMPKGQQTSIICQRTVTKNEPVTLIAEPPAGQSFVGWAGACSGTTTDCNFKPSAQTTVAATFMPISEPAVERLTVVYQSNPKTAFSLLITPKFTVICPDRPIGSPAQITTCIVDVPYGTKVAVQAYYASPLGVGMVTTGYWHGDCEGAQGASCNLTMDRPRNVTVGTF